MRRPQEEGCLFLDCPHWVVAVAVVDVHDDYVVGEHQVAVDNAARHVDADAVACVAALAGRDGCVDQADSSLAKGKHGRLGRHTL